VEECKLVDRDVFYAEPFEGRGIPDWGDYVIETDATGGRVRPRNFPVRLTIRRAR
jgi:hypothetical protein